jgi:hypothetical protein
MSPDEASNDPGSLHLQGGGVDKTIAIAGGFQKNETDITVDVLFGNVPTNASYTLDYIGGDGSVSNLVQSTPYHQLNDDALPSGSSDDQ